MVQHRKRIEPSSRLLAILLCGGVKGYLDRRVCREHFFAPQLAAGRVVGHDWGANVAWAVAGWHADRVRSLTAVSVPHPAAYTAAFRADPEQKERSAYIRLFWQEG
ncbi:MAG TPA: hypothetical protein VNT79_05480, partial [Phycisphaerae bacterium]|nr:hypothetical protein [Phycisphaerae bacterium]